ncbi:MAG: 16S rRNA (guanine(527)-N(7))-methyltransferase RsmG [Clostridia bacterium]|nr:16S rRNA (guanine(527)-N(7))-methyltransferase RsmG [Clostridia bacterium]
MMERSEFVLECQKAFDMNEMYCSEEQAFWLHALMVRMLEVNKTMNLTAITDEKMIILRHFVDSVTVSRYLPENSRLIDVGCGAGFPTLPLAIFRPDLRITALDGTAKRIRYVEETARLLSLANVTAIAGRAEEYAQDPNYRERFDAVTARAVAALPMLSELCLGFARVGGKMIAMKAQQASDEISLAKNAISLCGGELKEVVSCSLKQSDGEEEQRNLIIVQKITNTPKKYPRHFSQISKKTL